MAAEGGSTKRTKRLHSAKPYQRPKSLMRRVTDTVSGLIPWLSGGARRGMPHLDQQQQQQEEQQQQSRSGLNLEVVRGGPKPRIPLNSTLQDEQLPAASSQPPATWGFGRDSDTPAAADVLVMESSRPFLLADESLAGPSHEFVASTPALDTSSQGNHFTSPAADDKSDASGSTSGCSSMNPQVESRREPTRSNPPLGIFGGRSEARGGGIASQSDSRRRSGRKVLNISKNELDIDDTKDSESGSVRDVHNGKRSSENGGSTSSAPASQSSSKRPRFNPSIFGSPVWGVRKAPSVESLSESSFYSGKITFGGASAYRKSRLLGARYLTPPLPPSNAQPSRKREASLPEQAAMSSTTRKILQTLQKMSTPVLDARRIPLLRGAERTLAEASEILSERPPPAARLRMTGPPVATFTVPTKAKIAKNYAPPPQPLPQKSMGGGKMKSKTHMRQGRPQRDNMEEDPVPVDLPNVPLPLTSLPVFHLDMLAPKKQDAVGEFKFSNPEVVSAKGGHQHSGDEAKFSFSSPLAASGDTIAKPKAMFEFRPAASKELKKVESPTIGKVELKNGSVADKLPAADPKPLLPLSAALPKKAGWTCSECWVSNPEESRKCMACESDKPGCSQVKVPPVTVPLPMPLPTKDWTCSTCMVPNKLEVSKCVCCEAERPGAAKKWECDTCLVPNNPEATKCVCCEAPKPGTATAPAKVPFKFGAGGSASTSSSGPVFNFGVTAAKKDSEGFNFGAVTTTATTVSSSSFKFGGSGTTATTPSTSGFKFGSGASTATTTATTGFKFGSQPTSTSNSLTFGTKTTSDVTISVTATTVAATTTSATISTVPVFAYSPGSTAPRPSPSISSSPEKKEELKAGSVLDALRGAKSPTPSPAVALPSTSSQAEAAIVKAPEPEAVMAPSPAAPTAPPPPPVSETTAVPVTTSASSSTEVQKSSSATPGFKFDFGAKTTVTTAPAPVARNTSTTTASGGFPFTFGTSSDASKALTPAAPSFQFVAQPVQEEGQQPAKKASFGLPSADSKFTFGGSSASPFSTVTTTASSLTFRSELPVTTASMFGTPVATTTTTTAGSQFDFTPKPAVTAGGFSFGGTTPATGAFKFGATTTVTPATATTMTTTTSGFGFGATPTFGTSFPKAPATTTASSGFGFSSSAPAFGTSNPPPYTPPSFSSPAAQQQSTPQAPSNFTFSPAPTFNFGGQGSAGGVFTFTGQGMQQAAPQPGLFSQPAPAAAPPAAAAAGTSAPAQGAFSFSPQMPMSFAFGASGPAGSPQLPTMPFPSSPAVGNPFDVVANANPALAGRKMRKAVRRAHR